MTDVLPALTPPETPEQELERVKLEMTAAMEADMDSVLQDGFEWFHEYLSVKELLWFDKPAEEYNFLGQPDTVSSFEPYISLLADFLDKIKHTIDANPAQAIWSNYVAIELEDLRLLVILISNNRIDLTNKEVINKILNTLHQEPDNAAESQPISLEWVAGLVRGGDSPLLKLIQEIKSKSRNGSDTEAAIVSTEAEDLEVLTETLTPSSLEAFYKVIKYVAAQLTTNENGQAQFRLALHNIVRDGLSNSDIGFIRISTPEFIAKQKKKKLTLADLEAVGEVFARVYPSIELKEEDTDAQETKILEHVLAAIDTGLYEAEPEVYLELLSKVLEGIIGELEKETELKSPRELNKSENRTKLERLAKYRLYYLYLQNAKNYQDDVQEELWNKIKTPAVGGTGFEQGFNALFEKLDSNRLTESAENKVNLFDVFVLLKNFNSAAWAIHNDKSKQIHIRDALQGNVYRLDTLTLINFITALESYEQIVSEFARVDEFMFQIERPETQISAKLLSQMLLQPDKSILSGFVKRLKKEDLIRWNSTEQLSEKSMFRKVIDVPMNRWRKFRDRREQDAQDRRANGQNNAGSGRKNERAPLPRKLYEYIASEDQPPINLSLPSVVNVDLDKRITILQQDHPADIDENLTNQLPLRRYFKTHFQDAGYIRSENDEAEKSTSNAILTILSNVVAEIEQAEYSNIRELWESLERSDSLGEVGPDGKYPNLLLLVRERCGNKGVFFTLLNDIKINSKRRQYEKDQYANSPEWLLIEFITHLIISVLRKKRETIATGELPALSAQEIIDLIAADKKLLPDRSNIGGDNDSDGSAESGVNQDTTRRATDPGATTATRPQQGSIQEKGVKILQQENSGVSGFERNRREFTKRNLQLEQDKQGAQVAFLKSINWFRGRISLTREALKGPLLIAIAAAAVVGLANSSLSFEVIDNFVNQIVPEQFQGDNQAIVNLLKNVPSLLGAIGGLSLVSKFVSEIAYAWSGPGKQITERAIKTQAARIIRVLGEEYDYLNAHTLKLAEEPEKTDLTDGVTKPAVAAKDIESQANAARKKQEERKALTEAKYGELLVAMAYELTQFSADPNTFNMEKSIVELIAVYKTTWQEAAKKEEEQKKQNNPADQNTPYYSLLVNRLEALEQKIRGLNFQVLTDITKSANEAEVKPLVPAKQRGNKGRQNFLVMPFNLAGVRRWIFKSPVN